MRRKIFGASFWDLVDAFYSAMREYEQIHYLYELRVLAHAEEQGVDREWLRLEASEVSKLLDFDKLAILRNGALFRTKEISHSLLRSQGRTHKFDRYISEVFHDLSILREEQYKVSTFAEEYRRAQEMAEYESLLDEVHEDFPRRVHGIQGLFAKAQVELESVLRAHRTDPLYVRSLYLFGDEVFARIPSYPQGKLSHCWQVFPDGGPAEAFLYAARSFAQGGFKEKALRVLDQALELAQSPPPYGYGNEEILADLHRQALELKRGFEPKSPVELSRMELHRADPATGDDAAPGINAEVPEDSGSFEDLSDELATWAS